MEKTIDYYMSLPYRVEIVPEPEEGDYAAWYPDLYGCMTRAKTQVELLTKAEEAKREWIEKVLSEGLTVPEPYDLRNTLDYLERLDIFVPKSPSIVREDIWMDDGSAAYDLSSGKGHTIDDYMALPSDVRVELIDGAFIYMNAPTTVHQCIAGEMYASLRHFVESQSGECIPMIAPVDVRLDCDDKTMVQPDVLIVCDKSKITKQRVVGAPDFVAEVVSDSNPENDLVRKLAKYRHAGVREYWAVMPENKSVFVYVFERSFDPVEYTFADEIPVFIWEEKCRIDFKKIDSKIRFMTED